MTAPANKILMITGDQQLAGDFQKIFSEKKSHACQMIYAQQLAEGLSKLAVQSPDAVVLDLELPDSVANQTFQRFQDCSSGVPVIVIAGPDKELYALKAVENGAEAYLIKGQFGAAVFFQTLRMAAEKKKMKREYDRIHREFQTLLDSAEDGIIYLDKEGKVLQLNKAAADLTGYDPAELRGKTEHEALHYRKASDGTEHAPSGCLVTAALSGGFPGTAKDIVIYRKDGAAFPAEMQCYPLKDAGRVEGALLSIKDVTKKKEAEVRKKEAGEIKSHFISIVSHELRTPLMAIREGIELVQDGHLGKITSEQKDFLGTSLDNVRRLHRIVEDLLSFQELYSDRAEFEFESHDINSVIEKTVASVRSLAQEKKLDLVLSLNHDIPEFRFDVEKIEQVLLSILKNAISFTEAGSITVSSLPRGNTAEVLVRDTGRGIKEEDLGRLFSGFGQLEDADNRKTGGTGLGLAAARKIIERHVGHMWVKSEPGKGTTFSFVLPMLKGA